MSAESADKPCVPWDSRAWPARTDGGSPSVGSSKPPAPRLALAVPATLPVAHLDSGTGLVLLWLFPVLVIPTPVLSSGLLVAAIVTPRGHCPGVSRGQEVQLPPWATAWVTRGAGASLPLPELLLRAGTGLAAWPRLSHRVCCLPRGAPEATSPLPQARPSLLRGSSEVPPAGSAGAAQPTAPCPGPGAGPAAPRSASRGGFAGGRSKNGGEETNIEASQWNILCFTQFNLQKNL